MHRQGQWVGYTPLRCLSKPRHWGAQHLLCGLNLLRIMMNQGRSARFKLNVNPARTETSPAGVEAHSVRIEVNPASYRR